MYDLFNNTMGTITVGNIVLSNQSHATQNSKDRFRLAESHPLLDIDHGNSKSTGFMEELVQNGGTCVYDRHSGSVKLASNGVTGRSVYQSKEYVQPHAGASISCFMCANMNESSGTEATGSSRMGFFDSHEDKVQDSTGCGIFLECVGDELFMVKRTHTSLTTQTDERIASSSWNTDVMNGTSSEDNPSGYEVLSDDDIVLVIEVDGMKGVRTGFVLRNQIVYAHVFHDVVLPRRKLPLRAEVYNTPSTVSLGVFSLGVQAEGSALARGVEHRIDTDAAFLSVENLNTCFCSFRLGVGKERSTILVPEIRIVVSGSHPVYWCILLNATPDSPSWTDSGGIEVDQTSTTLTGGTVVRSGFVRDSDITSIHTDSSILTLPVLTSTIAGVPDTYSVQFKTISGISVNVSASLRMTFKY